MRLAARFSAFLLLTAFSAVANAGDVSVQLDAGASFSLRNSAGAIVRLRVDEATGNVSRNGALFVHTTGGANNLFVGPAAGNLSATGSGDTAAGFAALTSLTSGSYNSALGGRALRNNTSGGLNSAVGAYALYANTSGGYNSAFGSNALALNTIGGFNSALGVNALRSNLTGSSNTAVGYSALFANTASGNSAFGTKALFYNTSGASNTAVGRDALFANSTGDGNTAVGDRALRENTTGYSNSVVGNGALRVNSTGRGNAAVGDFALYSNTGGVDNVAFGSGSLFFNTTGSRNIAVGRFAGFDQTTGNDNIYIANQGVAGESGRIRLGTVGTHTQTHVAGVHGATSGGGIGVLVNASGTLGTTTSSARFKQDVRDMGEASDVVMKLRPVTFRYREEAVGAEDAQTTQYGLIAEEVAEVAPELVAPDLEGKPYSVKYHELPALLVNEIQRQREEIAALRARVARLETR